LRRLLSFSFVCVVRDPQKRSSSSEEEGEGMSLAIAASSSEEEAKKEPAYDFQILPAGPPPNMSKRRLIFDSLKKIIGRNFRMGGARLLSPRTKPKSAGKRGIAMNRTGAGAEAGAGAGAAADGTASAAAGAADDGDSSDDAGSSKRTALGLNPSAPAYKWGTYLFSWGAGYQGQLGRRFERYAKKYAMTPEIIRVNLAVRQVSAGALHSGLVTDEGRVWTWGDGRQEQLGYTPKAYTNQLEPTEIIGLLRMQRSSSSSSTLTVAGDMNLG
jgi:hypothetical protein